ncbi:MAG TPA: hypothetical protein VFH57_03350 [Gammaproteobacteria bacterium]|nr:hypothetical protein [Gammaproteobacteria bacterium]
MTDRPSDSLPSLPAAEYHRIVAPVLQVTAEIAAVRGDPDLFNDMPSMLALMTLVTALADCYLQQNPGEADAVSEAVKAAPTGACLMVLNRGEMEQAQINDCIWALQAGMTQLVEARVLGRERKLAQDAWQLLADGDRDGAVERLKRAATGIVMDIDQWERARGEDAI